MVVHRTNAGLINDTQGLLKQGISDINSNSQAGFAAGYAKMDTMQAAVDANAVLLNKTYAAVLSNGEAIEKVSRIVSQCLAKLGRVQQQQTSFYVS
jgi:hypothetical protein